MRRIKGTQIFKTLCSLGGIAICLNAPQLFAQASKPRVNNEKPEKGNQVKRIHPHALKLILQGNKKEAIAYLEATSEKAVNPEHTKICLLYTSPSPRDRSLSRMPSSA